MPAMFRYRIHQRKNSSDFERSCRTDSRLSVWGDEPYNVINRSYVENADWLLCEAFCLYEDREVSNLIRSTTVRHWTSGDWLQELGSEEFGLYITPKTVTWIPASNLICVKLHKHSPEPFMYRTIWKGLTFE